MNNFLTKKLIAHPALTGALLQPDWAARFNALPIPPFSEIPSGFDAILQFRSDFLRSQLVSSLLRSALLGITGVLDYASEGLSERANEEITRLVENEVVEGPPASGGRVTELEPHRFEVEIRRTHLTLEPGNPARARIRWIVYLKIIARETEESAERRRLVDDEALRRILEAMGVDPLLIGLPIDRVERSILLAQWTVLTSALVEIGTNPSQFQVWASLNFADSELTLRFANEIFHDFIRDEAFRLG